MHTPAVDPSATLWRLLAALAAGGAFAWAALWARALTTPAALLGGALGACLIGLGGGAWGVPALLFFVSSAALSRLPGGAEEADAPRTARQVLANGGVAWALLLAAPLAPEAVAALCYWGFAGAFAAAAADTWATEGGERFGGVPWSLRTGRRAVPGASGAVSLVGTLAACGGAVVVAAGTVPFASRFGMAPLAAVLLVAGAGVAGAAADSLAGAFLQARYRDAYTGRRTESPYAPDGRRNRRVQGMPALANSGVNVLCTATGALTAMVGAY